MIKQLLIFSIVVLCTGLHASAQHAYFPTKGKITFEREVYQRARMREMNNKMASQGQNAGMMMRFGGNIEDVPEKSSDMLTLQFDEKATLMQFTDPENASTRPNGNRSGGGGNRGGGGGRGGQPMGAVSMGGGSVQVRGGGFGGRRPQFNKIFFQDLQNQTSEVEMELDEKYNLKDSLQQVTWRFTDEYRNIAGYECRRVNGATADSLYIIAFYTDQIPVSGGPALVNGLPGMILGLVIPEMHINYWARNVEFTVDNVPKQWRDKKSKAMTMEEFFKSLSGNRMFGGGASGGKQLKRNLLENLIY